MSATGGRRWFAAGVFVVYVALAVLLNLSVWRAPLASYIGQGSDPQQAFWFLTWTPYAIGHLHNPLISDHMNYPNGVNLMWQTWMPAAGVLLAPVTAVWGATATYNVIITVSPALAAFLAFLAIRRLVPGSIPAMVGGLLYGFSPFVMAQSLGHAHMVLSAITPPLVLMLLDELLLRQRMRTWALALLVAGCGVLQFFIAEEVFVSEILVAALVTALLAVSRWSEVRMRARYAAHVLWRAAVVTAAVIAVPLAVQVVGPETASGVAFHSSDIYLTDAANLVLPTSVQWLAPDPLQHVTMQFTGNATEWDGYIGLPLLAVLVTALVRCWNSLLIRVAGLTAVVMMVFALGPHLHIGGHVTQVPLPEWVVAHLPYLKNLQPNRMTLYVFLAAAVGFAFVLRRLSAGAGRARVVTAAAVAAVALPLVPAFPVRSTLQVPSFFTTPQVNLIPEDSIALTAPWTGIQDTSNMLAQQATGLRYHILGGYFLGPLSSSAAAVRDALIAIQENGTPPVLDGATRQTMLTELHDDHVTVAIAMPGSQQARYAAYLTALLGATPENVGGVDVWLMSPAH
jgi:hypothetical protein